MENDWRLLTTLRNKPVNELRKVKANFLKLGETRNMAEFKVINCNVI